jgi:hypothetical protein
LHNTSELVVTDSANIEENTSKSTLSLVGMGCAGLGCLVLLLAMALVGAILVGVFNYSMVPQMWASSIGGLCCGLSGLAIGGGLFVFGKKGAADEDEISD